MAALIIAHLIWKTTLKHGVHKIANCFALPPTASETDKGKAAANNGYW